MKPLTQKQVVRFFLTGSHSDTSLVALACLFGGHSYDKIIKRLHKEANKIFDGKSSEFADGACSEAVDYFSDDTHLDHGEN
tara:strand:- start:337 stop:579 length:243 start_codon:yes stop_codon:yes gene_type:complete